MSTFPVQHCSLTTRGKHIELLAFIPEKYLELSRAVSEIVAFPFAQVLDDELFLDISLREIQRLRAFFPNLERAVMLFDDLTLLFPLTLGEEIEELISDQYLSPEHDVVFFAPKGEVSSRLH